MKITYNAWRALCFIAGAILIVFGFIADEGRGNAACLCLGCVLAAAVVCSMLTTWTSGQLGHLAYSRAARRWFPWLAFLAFCLQAMGLNLMLGQAGQFHWSFLVFDGIILLMFAAAMKMVFLKNWHPEGQGQPVKIKTMWKVFAMITILAYLFDMAAKATAIMYYGDLSIQTYPWSNVNWLTLVVSVSVFVGITTRTLIIPLEPKLNEIETFILYFETTIYVVDSCDALSLYGVVYGHVDDATTRGAIAAVAGICAVAATLLYFLPVALSKELQEAILTEESPTKQKWVARASREGAACLIDAPLFIIRLLLWIKWQVPVTALFMKNVLGILVFRSLGDYIQFVNPVVTGSRRGSTASRMEEGKEMQPALYGVKAKELNAKVQMRERQLKEHREALIRYKAELDHMVEEVQKRDRMLEMKQNMYLVGGEIDEFRDSLHQGMQKTDRSGSLDAASPSSQAFSVNQPLYFRGRAGHG